MAAIKWVDVDFKWHRLTLADKVEKTRTIPLTAYLAHQPASLPCINQFVFASYAKGCRITEPRASHAKVMLDAGCWHNDPDHSWPAPFILTAGAPAGAIAQVMGHKSSAIAEGYRPRRVNCVW